MNNMISIENTKFFSRNFSGDPTQDRFGDDRRKCCIIIPDPNQAQQLADMGVNVKKTKPHDDDDPDDFVPTFFIQCVLKYADKFGNPLKYPPAVYLVNDDNIPTPLTEETVGILDRIRVKNVNVVLNASERDGKTFLYIRTIYVEQDVEDDPFASRYARRNGPRKDVIE